MKPTLLYFAWITLGLLGTEAARAQERFVIQQVAPGVYVSAVSDPDLFAQYANSLIVVGDDGVLIVDSRDTPHSARQLAEEVRALTDKPIQYVVNTHFHWDHINGNAALQEDYPSVQIVAAPETARLIEERGPSALAAEVERLRARQTRLNGYLEAGETDSGRPLTQSDLEEIDRILSADAERIAGLEEVELALPTISVRGQWRPEGFGRKVHVLEVETAHAPGNVVVWVPDAELLFMGDLIEHGFPWPGDGAVLGHAPALNELAALKARLHVPGHGPLPEGTSLFEGQRSFWNELHNGFQGEPVDSTAAAGLSALLIESADLDAFPGARSPAGEPSDGFRAFVRDAINQAQSEASPPR